LAVSAACWFQTDSAEIAPLCAIRRVPPQASAKGLDEGKSQCALHQPPRGFRGNGNLVYAGVVSELV
jgi:hypothetical protein